jgi:RHS repeat-associated protein
MFSKKKRIKNNMETLAAVTTELYHKATEGRAYIYATRYYYDESGNRIRKLIYFNAQADPAPITDWNNPGNGWTLSNNEFYLKGIDGKDLATYQGNVLDEWFVWGNDLTGKIKNDKEYYYYKDHLGSVRVVVDNTGAIVAGYDYDAWGYPLENRNYNGDSIKYKYTGKEFDKESFYDYFGVRYYDSRIGRWGVIDPASDFEPSLNPYHYTNNNPLKFVDPNGLDYYFYLEGSSIPVRYPHIGDNEYYFYHPMGDVLVEASGDYLNLNNLRFYKASSEITSSFFFKYNYYYRYKDVNLDFENNEGPKLIDKALSDNYYFLLPHIAIESETGGIFDYKKHLSSGSLYLFHNYVYNKEEAGNILWGITMAYYKVPLDQTLAGANIYTIMKRLEFDEPNEQTAIMRGYLSYDKTR